MRTSDADVRSAVDRELLTEAGVNSANVDVGVIDGIAILTGHTDTLLGRRRAAETAKRVAGARGLIDRLEVRAPSRPDEALRADIQSGLLLDPVSES